MDYGNQISQKLRRILISSQLSCLGLALCFVYSLGTKLAAQQDPFKRGGRGESTSVVGDEVDPLSPSNELLGEKLGWRAKLQRVIVLAPWFTKWQRNIQAQVSWTALEIKQRAWRDSWYLYALGLLFAVVFGFLHIAGPGHGKIFTISYFMSRKATLKEGLWLSALISVVDSLSAGFVVFLTYSVLRLSFSESQWVEAIISVFSYGIILVWGVWHLCSHLFGRHNCHGHSHSHDHRDRDCGGHSAEHIESSGPHAETARVDPHAGNETGLANNRKTARSTWVFALGIGLVPCPISTALLVFGVLNQILGLAIFLVLGVSVGGMIAMTMLSFAVIGGKKGAGSMLQSSLRLNAAQKPVGATRFRLLDFLSEGVEIIALILMIVLGGLLLLLSLPL